MDKSGVNYTGQKNINFLQMLAGLISFVEIIQNKYLNNLIEQDRRFINKITNPMMGFKTFHSAKAPLYGIETTHMIRKGQLSDKNNPLISSYGFSKIAVSTDKANLHFMNICETKPVIDQCDQNPES